MRDPQAGRVRRHRPVGEPQRRWSMGRLRHQVQRRQRWPGARVGDGADLRAHRLDRPLPDDRPDARRPAPTRHVPCRSADGGGHRPGGRLRSLDGDVVRLRRHPCPVRRWLQAPLRRHERRHRSLRPPDPGGHARRSTGHGAQRSAAARLRWPPSRPQPGVRPRRDRRAHRRAHPRHGRGVGRRRRPQHDRRAEPVRHAIRQPRHPRSQRPPRARLRQWARRRGAFDAHEPGRRPGGRAARDRMPRDADGVEVLRQPARRRARDDLR